MRSDRSELLAHFQLDGADAKLLKRAGEMAAPLLPQLLDEFYQRVEETPSLAKFFDSPDMIDQAKAAQGRHWETLLTGDFGDEYFASARRVGEVHPKIGLPFSFFLSGYAFATSRMQELMLQKRKGLFKSPPRDIAVLMGVMSRAFGLDSHLILEAHFANERAEQERAFNYLTDGIRRIADRDLSTPIPSPAESDYPQRFDGVRESFNSAQLALRQVVYSIQDAAQSLNTVVVQVSQAAEELSQRTESQAATLEQTSASIEEITQSISSANEATHQTSANVDSSRRKAEEGSTVVNSAIDKMNEISESSAKISKIIGVIDDISFQTNLLSLNAGVEAARAGESGRGFAVVAAEVGALARRAADSAQEIKELISVSRDHVHSGVELVGRTGTVLADIFEDIQQASSLTSDVANSSDLQSTGIREINIGVSQLDNVTQQNAAMVEETTAALMEMRKDAGNLTQLVDGFTLGTTERQDDVVWDVQTIDTDVAVA